MAISLTYITPSYGITFISGLEPTINNNDYYWWIENNTNCPLKISASISAGENNNGEHKYEVTLNKAELNVHERTILKVKKMYRDEPRNVLININQNSKCNSTRITRIVIDI
ncbi:UNVERIFIED_CONTAM: hypothetical protein I5919_17105 [Aeromonas hydrophila]